MMENNFYKTIVENSPVGYLYNRIIYDDNGRPIDYEIIKVNKAFESMINTKSEDLIGRQISHLYESIVGDKYTWNEFYSSVISHFNKEDFEYSFDFLNKYFRVKSHSPEKDYIVMYLTDISAEVKESEKLHMLSDHIPIQVWYLIDSKTYGLGNKAHADFMGIEKKDLAYKDINDLLSKENAKICIEGNEKVFREKKQVIIKSWSYNCKGERKLLKITKNPKFNLKGDVEFVICSAEDITEEYISKDQSDVKERILYSTLEFTEELLVNKDHYSALSNGIEILGNATKVDRVYYWENHYDEESEKWLTSQKFEWCLGDVEQQIDNPSLQNIPFEEVGDFIGILSQNKPFNSHTKNLDVKNSNTKKILQDQDILSILVLPVFVKAEFRGFIGFDSCSSEKEWSHVEISLLNSFVLLYIKSLERSLLEKHVMQVNENFNNFFNMIQDQLFVLDFQGNIIHVNNTVLDRLDYSREELLGESVLMFYPKEKREEVLDNIKNFIIKKIDCYDIPAMTKDGEIFPVETRISEGLWNGEKVLFLVSKDISQLSMSEEKFSKAFNNSGVSMFISRFEDGKILEANDKFSNFIGYEKNEIIGKTTLDLKMIVNYKSREKLKKEIEIHDKISDMEIDIIRKDNVIRKGLSNIVSIIINNERCLLSSIIDVTMRVKYEEKLLDISNRDHLTGIYNRRYVYQRLGEIIEEYKRDKSVFSLAIIDIDDFKLINDTHGHQVGDCVLKEFAKTIEEELRLYDVLGRYGGEEFIIILNHTDTKESLLILERISNIIKNKAFVFDGNFIKLTFSTGIASCRELEKEEIKIETLISIADKRMYNAKNSGKNKIVYK